LPDHLGPCVYWEALPVSVILLERVLHGHTVLTGVGSRDKIFKQQHVQCAVWQLNCINQCLASLGKVNAYEITSCMMCPNVMLFASNTPCNSSAHLHDQPHCMVLVQRMHITSQSMAGIADTFLQSKSSHACNPKCASTPSSACPSM
jgi:hypothetical protein